MPNVFPEVWPDKCRRRHQAFQTRIRAANGGLQINEPHPFDQSFFACEWSVNPDTDIDAILTHWRANKGQYFTFFDFNLRAIDAVQFGTGNGATTIFTLPARSVSSVGLVILRNGVAQTLGVHFSLSVGTGTDGEDQAVFAVAPAAAAVLTFAAARARRRHLVFYPPEIEEDPYEADLVKWSIEFEERIGP